MRGYPLPEPTRWSASIGADMAAGRPRPCPHSSTTVAPVETPDRRNRSGEPAPSALQNVAVVSGRYPATEFESAPNHRAYCDAHGYTYVHCNWPTGQQIGYLNKVEYVLYYFDRFDWIFWIDDDAFFVDLDRSLDHLVPPGDKFMSVCSSPSYKDIVTPISSGQFLLRTTDLAHRFLLMVRDADLDVVREWWTDDLGYFTGGDQDAMVYAMRTDQAIGDGIEIFDAATFNSRIDEVVAGQPVFLLHFTGPRWTKRHDAKRAAEVLGRGPELLPAAVADRLGVRHTPSWIVREAWDWRTRGLRFARRVRAGRG